MKNPKTVLAASLQYDLLAYRHDQLYLPGALWLLFVIIFAFFRSPGFEFDVAGAYFGIVVPLIAGVLAASAVLTDPALELHFSSPRPAWFILAERLGLILVASGVTALAFQGFVMLNGMDLSPFGSFFNLQLDWLVPSLALMSLAASVSFGFKQSTPGALFTGLIWLVQVLLREWFLATPAARYFFLFTGVRAPDSPSLAANMIVLVAISAGLTILSIALIRKTERYL